MTAIVEVVAREILDSRRNPTVEADVLLTGGVAKNIGLFEALGQSLGVALQTPSRMDPQLNGALGAALLAQEG